MTQTSQLASQNNLNTHSIGMRAVGGKRLCGAGRTVDAVYIECGEMLGGTPIEQFLLDPPENFDPVQFSLNAVGSKLFYDEYGTAHILDWVGESHYPYPADFIEEARKMGVSRKISVDQAQKLSRASFLYLMHPKGHMTNGPAVSKDSSVICPTGIHSSNEQCCGLHWVIPDDNGSGRRRIMSWEYEVTPRKNGLPEAVYGPGIFMKVPITNRTMIAQHNGSYDAQKLKTLNASTLPTYVAQT